MLSESVTVGNGKYTITNDNGKLTALRNGEPWDRDLVGDNLVYWMMVRIQELEAAVKNAGESVKPEEWRAIVKRLVGTTDVAAYGAALHDARAMLAASQPEVKASRVNPCSGHAVESDRYEEEQSAHTARKRTDFEAAAEALRKELDEATTIEQARSVYRRQLDLMSALVEAGA